MGLVYLLGGALLVALIVAAALRTMRERRRRKRLAQRLDDERTVAASRIQALNQHLKSKALALENANNELESFSYSMAHDLRTPLRAIGSYAAMLQEDFGPQLPEEACRYVRLIGESAARVEALIADLLAFAGLGRTALCPQTYDPRPQVFESCREVLAGHVGAHPEIIVGELPAVQADAALLQHVWLNLIGNAVKFSGKTPAARVEIGGRLDGTQVIFHVKDNGAGFDMRYVSKLFGVFERLHGQEEFCGTGVGLAIVRRVIGRHGGQVWGHGEVGHGATFFFSLPKEGVE